MPEQDTVLADILEDELVSVPAQNEMEELSKLIKIMQLKQVAADIKAKELAIINEDIRVLSEIKIPEKFLQMNIQEIKMENGSKVTISKVYNASISGREVEAFGWLKENGMDDLIKHEVKLNFGKGEDEIAATLVAALREQDYIVDDKKTVHPQTLKAFVKEQIEIGNPNFKRETFGVFIIDRTKIKGGK